MKLTNSLTMKRKSGMTLLELTVVILVLLSLISILFIGARAWKKGSDRAGCILNIRNFQQAVRSYGNMNNYAPGDVVDAFSTTIYGPGLFMENFPKCPTGTTVEYTVADALIPQVGDLVLSCNYTGTPLHEPSSYGDW